MVLLGGVPPAIGFRAGWVGLAHGFAVISFSEAGSGKLINAGYALAGLKGD